MAIPEIDFPPTSESPFTDDNGYIWDWLSTKWVRRSQNTLTEAPLDSKNYTRIDATWAESIPVDPAAPGALYVRKDGGWFEVTDVGSGISDAPSDSIFYGRKDATWVTPDVGDMPTLQAALDAKADIGHVHVLNDITDSGELAALNDAPDSSEYVRVRGAWVAPTPAAGVVFNNGITIINPQDTDDGTLFFSINGINIVGVNGHILGAGSSVICNVKYAPNRNDPGTKLFTNDIDINTEAGASFPVDSAAIPINSWVWLEIVSVSGDPLMTHLSLAYSQN